MLRPLEVRPGKIFKSFDSQAHANEHSEFKATRTLSLHRLRQWAKQNL